MIGALLLRRPELLVIVCSSRLTRLSGVWDGFQRKSSVEIAVLPVCRMLLSLCDLPEGRAFMSQMPSANSPSWMTSYFMHEYSFDVGRLSIIMLSTPPKPHS